MGYPAGKSLYSAWIKVQKQKDKKACTSFAIANCLMIMYWFWKDEKVLIDGSELRKAQLGFLKRDDAKTIGVREGFEFMTLIGFKGIYAHAPAKLKKDDNFILRCKRWINKNYPIIFVISNKKQTHAVCCYGYDVFEDRVVFYVMDSLKGKTDEITDIDSIKEAYITFLP